MAQNLTENLIDLSDWRLGANRTAEFAFNHAESCFNVRPLVIVVKESIPD